MLRLIPLALVAALIVGCDSKPSGLGTTKSGGGGHDSHDDHDHDRGKMKLADFGPNHAALTAHIDKNESNLAILFETLDKEPKPVGLKITEFKATAKRAGDDKTYELVFKPGPKEERKHDKEGECSHFEAEAKWMKPDDTLSVTAMIEWGGKERKVEWKDFVPKKFNHADDEKKK